MSISDVTVATSMLTFMVIGATQLVKNLFDRNFRGAVIIAVAALVGGLAGAFIFPVIGFGVGIVAGLSASGVVTTAQNIGGPKPTTPAV